MWETILSKIDQLDVVMVTLFQRVTNRLGMSNYRIAGICCWLFAMLMYLWVRYHISMMALWSYMIASGIAILGIFVFRTLEDADRDALNTPWMDQWRGAGGGFIRTFMTIALMTKAGSSVYAAIRHNSGYEWIQIGLTALVLAIFYFSAGEPPYQRKKIRVRKNNKK